MSGVIVSAGVIEHQSALSALIGEIPKWPGHIESISASHLAAAPGAETVMMLILSSPVTEKVVESRDTCGLLNSAANPPPAV